MTWQMFALACTFLPHTRPYWNQLTISTWSRKLRSSWTLLTPGAETPPPDGQVVIWSPRNKQQTVGMYHSTYLGLWAVAAELSCVPGHLHWHHCPAGPSHQVVGHRHKTIPDSGEAHCKHQHAPERIPMLWTLHLSGSPGQGHPGRLSSGPLHGFWRCRIWGHSEARSPEYQGPTLGRCLTYLPCSSCFSFPICKPYRSNLFLGTSGGNWGQGKPLPSLTSTLEGANIWMQGIQCGKEKWLNWQK